MIQPDVLAALNKQVNAELESAYIYLSAGSYLDNEDYNGMASWLINHAHEEYHHAMRIRDFISDKDEKTIFKPLADPEGDWKGVIDVWQKIYDHELLVTSMILDIVRLAREKGDITAEIFLNWFVKEQVEEEKITRDILNKVRIIGDNKGALINYDVFLTNAVKEGVVDTAALAVE